MPQDDKLAYMWINLAIHNGDKNAEKTRDMVIKEMNQSDIAKAKEMSSRCLASNYQQCGY